jgi:6-phosphogluconolactonase (cycloisomerase 2 family)
MLGSGYRILCFFGIEHPATSNQTEISMFKNATNLFRSFRRRLHQLRWVGVVLTLFFFFTQPAAGQVLTFVEFAKDGVAGVDGLSGAFAVTVSPDGKHVYVAGRFDNAVAVFSRDATTGELTFVEVLIDGGIDGAGNTIDGLFGARGVTVSPDGKHVYVAGGGDHAVAVFSRDATTGKLTFVEALIDGGTDGVGNMIDGLGLARGVTVSPDGKHVYVTGQGDDAVAVFSRDAATGKLTFVEALKDGGIDGAGNTIDGLDAASGVTVSPDGKHVYVAGDLDNAVAVFSRDATTDKLTFVEALKDGGTDGASNTIDGLFAATGVTVSPDGKHVYVASGGDHAVAVFSRNAATGKLTFVEALIDGGTDGAGNTIDGLLAAIGVTASPDGKHVYVTGFNDDAVAVFSRDAATGKLTFVEVLIDGGTDGAGNTIDGLDAAVGVTVSPDGKHVYVAGQGDDAVTVFAAVKAFVLLADEDVEINGQVNSEGDIHANNDITFNEGNPSQHTGDLTAVDDIIIKKKNKIIGTAAGDEVKNAGTITGGITRNAGIAIIPLPILPDLDARGKDLTVAKSKTRVLDPGDYGKITVEAKGTLKLKSGDYNLYNLKTGEKAVLIIDLTSGLPITINLDKRLVFGKNVIMKLLPSTASTTLITFNIDEDDDDGANDQGDVVVIGEGARVFGNIIAPETAVEISAKALFKGAICAENIRVKKGARFVHHSSTASFPKESEIDESEVANERSPVTSYRLEQNYPNPFNPSTTIQFNVLEAGVVQLSIYNLQGQEVRRLVSAEMNAGRHTVNWNGRDHTGKQVPSGVYLYKLRVNGFEETKKMTLMK